MPRADKRARKAGKSAMRKEGVMLPPSEICLLWNAAQENAAVTFDIKVSPKW